ncbi:hypothetical protein, partial [Flavobacterium sp.]|uniref:hypothetical protein n=1 Tax=Flavobacterium sp. TaxID=239 RepID=UPI001B514579
ICVSHQEVYVAKQIYPLQYVGDFKVLDSYRNKGVGLNLCNQLGDYIIETGVDLAFLNFSKGNDKPLSFFKNRLNIPDFENIGVFNILQFIGKRRKLIDSKFKIEETPITNELIQFLNDYYLNYELGSVITKEKLKGTTNFIIRNNFKIIAAISLIDTMSVKQNVVMHISWKIKYALQLINLFKSLLGISKMPVLNQPVKMIYVKYLAVNDNEKDMVKELINYARNIVFQKEYSFVSIGLHENDPLNNCFKGLLKLTFNSVGMLLSIKNNKKIMQNVKQGIPFEDFSLV